MFTADPALVIQWEDENVRRAFAALRSTGDRPTVPVTAEGFADPVTRRAWIRDKGMRVLQFWSDGHRETGGGVSVREPFRFEREDSAAARRTPRGGGQVRFVTLGALMAMRGPQPGLRISRTRRSRGGLRVRGKGEVDWILTTWEVRVRRSERGGRR